jgi:hypothetical protein
MANQFLNSGASRSELLAALMDKQNRRYSQQQDPSSIGEAFARTGSRLVDAYSQKKLVDDELERRQKQQGVDRKAYETAFSGTPEVLGYDQSRQDMTDVTGPDTYDALPMPPMSVLEEAIVGGSDQAYGQAMNTKGLSNQAFANLYNKRDAAQTARNTQARAERNREKFTIKYDQNGNAIGQESSLTGEMKPFPDAPTQNKNLNTVFDNNGNPTHQVDIFTGEIFAVPDNLLTKKKTYRTLTNEEKAKQGYSPNHVVQERDDGSFVWANEDLMTQRMNLNLEDAKEYQTFALGAEKARRAIRNIDELIGRGKVGDDDYIAMHSGADGVLGSSEINIDYSDIQEDFVARYNQYMGGIFLEGIQGLKGTGPVTDVEGGKAAQSLQRATLETSPELFRSALLDYRQTLIDSIAIKEGFYQERSNIRAGGQPKNRTPIGDM